LKGVSGIMLPLLMVSIVMVLASPISIIAQSNSTTTVYLDTPTINGTVVGQPFTVNLSISNAQEIMTWNAGMTFNATLLNCTEYKEGEFLKSAGSTIWLEGVINNTTGEITFHGSTLLGDINATGDGRLAYLTFKVKSPGISDIHLRDVKVGKKEGFIIVEVKINIIDVYTVVLDTTPHTIVTVSNSTGKTGTYSSGFSAHAYNPTLNTLSFHVTGPNPGFSNVTIPKTLLWGDFLVIIDDIQLGTEEIIATENATHTSLYFTYNLGIHKIQITTVSYQLIVTSSPTTGIPFTINGNPQTTPYTEWLPEGSYTLEMPETHNRYIWSHWLEDGDTNRTKTVTMDTSITLTGIFAPPVGGISIPLNKLSLLAP